MKKIKQGDIHETKLVEYEVLPWVDEFCRVDGAEFDFIHISRVELSLPSGISELYHDA